MTEKFYFVATTYKGFIKAMTISESPRPAINFALKNLGYYVRLMSVEQIREAYCRLGLRFEVDRTQKNPFK